MSERRSHASAGQPAGNQPVLVQGEILLALFDSACRYADGKHWAWRHPAISHSLLDDLFYRVADRRTQHLDQGGPDDVPIGYAQVDAEWRCWYRFLAGGRDQQGRPGRFLLLCFFGRNEDNAFVSPLWLSTNPVFQQLVNTACTNRPVPAPDSLASNLPALDNGCNQELLNDVLRKGRMNADGDARIEEVALVCSHLPRSREWQWWYSPTRKKAEVILAESGLPAPTVATHSGTDRADDVSFRVPDERPTVTCERREYLTPLAGAVHAAAESIRRKARGELTRSGVLFFLTGMIAGAALLFTAQWWGAVRSRGAIDPAVAAEPARFGADRSPQEGIDEVDPPVTTEPIGAPASIEPENVATDRPPNPTSR